MDDPFSCLRFAILGMPVSNISRGHGTAVFLEFGELTPRKRSDGTNGNSWGEISVGLEFDWRMELGKTITCGSGGNRELWDSSFKALEGATAIDFTLNGIVAELCLELSTGHRLLTCSLYEDGPDWALTDRRKATPLWVSFQGGQIIESDGLQRSA